VVRDRPTGTSLKLAIKKVFSDGAGSKASCCSMFPVLSVRNPFAT